MFEDILSIEETKVTVRQYRHRTTVPTKIFKLLDLKDGDALRWIAMKNGKIFIEKIVPAAQKFAPDFILISAGFDAHGADPLAGMNLTEDFYGELTTILRELAISFCDGRIISVLEGGYDSQNLANSVECHIRALM